MNAGQEQFDFCKEGELYYPRWKEILVNLYYLFFRYQI